jgi:hypothetical protein
MGQNSRICRGFPKKYQRGEGDGRVAATGDIGRRSLLVDRSVILDPDPIAVDFRF